MNVKDLIGLIDLFLVPLYFIFFLILAYLYKKKHAKDPQVKRYFVPGFIYKIMGGLIYALLVVYYWGFGDTATYFNEVLFFRDLLAQDKTSFYQIFTFDYSYFRDKYQIIGSINNNGFMVTKIALILSYFSFSRFLVTTMLFSVITYASLFTLFKTFVSILPKQHFIIALATLFFPSIAIYGSGILKDAVCIAALGFFFCSSYQIVIKRNFALKHFMGLFVTASLIIAVKSYILAGFLVPLIIIFIIRLTHGIKNSLLRYLLLTITAIFSISLLVVFTDSIMQALGVEYFEKLQDEIIKLQNEYAGMTENADSNFSIGAIDPSLSGFFKKLPVGFTATLFRPFLWEIGSLFTAVSSLESLAILMATLFTIFKTRVRFFKALFSDPTIFMCIIFSMIFASLVGLSTLNFGTLARYRIPVIPFYLMGLLMILMYNQKTKQKKLSKTPV